MAPAWMINVQNNSSDELKHSSQIIIPQWGLLALSTRCSTVVTIDSLHCAPGLVTRGIVLSQTARLLAAH